MLILVSFTPQPLLDKERWNTISTLTDSHGSTIIQKKDINAYILNYFFTLYSTELTLFTLKLREVQSELYNMIPLEGSSQLDYSLGERKLLTALKFFRSLKSLGPNGLHPIFNQNYWDIVGKTTIDFCMKVFQNHEIPPHMNKTYLCLIPKSSMLFPSRILSPLDFVTRL